MSIAKRIKKHLTKLHKYLAKVIRYRCPKTARRTLVMTLLIRNDADILRKNIEFHLGMGVDYIFVTDNGSTDETPIILKEYADKGILTIINEPYQKFTQAIWVNRMADMAFAKFGACYIFHCDTDEFWHSKSSNLKNELSQFPLIESLSVKINNVLPLFNNFTEKFPDDCLLNIHNPLPSSDVETDSQQKSMFLFSYSTKVMYRATKSMPHVRGGNHRLIDGGRYIRKNSEDICIYHFPVRGFDHFQKKVTEGGAAILSNPDLSPRFGWHWRKWHQQYLDGNIKTAYRQLMLDMTEAEKYASEGILEINSDLPRAIMATS